MISRLAHTQELCQPGASDAWQPQGLPGQAARGSACVRSAQPPTHTRQVLLQLALMAWAEAPSGQGRAGELGQRTRG